MSHISYTYARALKAAFKKENNQSFFSFVEELNQLNKILSLQEIKRFFLSLTVSVEEKKQVLKKVFVSFQFNDLICSFLFLLLDKKRWRELDDILICLHNMEEEIKGVISVEVKSVHALTDDLRGQLIENLEKFFNKKISLKEKSSSDELMGGIKVRSGGVVLDNTLLFHLIQMENQIRRNFYDYTGK